MRSNDLDLSCLDECMQRLYHTFAKFRSDYERAAMLVAELNAWVEDQQRESAVEGSPWPASPNALHWYGGASRALPGGNGFRRDERGLRRRSNMIARRG